MKHLAGRLARAVLWLLLVGGPLLHYSVVILPMLLEATGIFAGFSDSYIAGQPLAGASPAIHWERLARLPLALLVIAVKIGPVLLLSGVVSALLLALGRWLVRRRWPHWALRSPATALGLGGRLLGLVSLAYGLGCLVHWLVPAAWFNPPVVPPGFAFALEEDYLWPYFKWPSAPEAPQGWTIYAPGYVDLLAFATTKASSIKLSSLLVVLLFYRYRRRGLASATTATVAPVV
jgi:hypothetical protein